MYYTTDALLAREPNPDPPAPDPFRSAARTVERIQDLADGVTDRLKELAELAGSEAQALKPDMVHLCAVEWAVMKMALGLTPAAIALQEDELARLPAFQEVATDG